MEGLGRAFVFAQFVLIAGLIAVAELWVFILAGSLAVIGLLLAGVVVGALALWANRPGNFNIRPLPKAGGQFVQHGIYRFIRHPMYTAVLLFGLACVVSNAVLLVWVIWIALAVVLLGKALLEEKLMARQYPGYVVYMSRTRRLIPWLI